MASRTKQKEEARARRLAEEQARAEKARRDRRLRMLGGVVLIAVALVAVAIAVSSSGGGSKTNSKPNSKSAQQTDSKIDALLSGIPQSGMTLGSPSAKVTVTEFGDLECPICQEFALGAEDQLIQNDVRTGKVKLVYRSLETASSESPIPNVFPTQQKAAYAAGLQDRGWYYIELFYSEQGQEGTGYVTESYLDGLAQQIPGLNYGTWKLDRNSSNVNSLLTADTQAASAKGFQSTPTVVVTGPKGQQVFDQSLEPYSTYQSAINSVV